MKSIDEYLLDAERAHGHLCAGQVLGVRLAMRGLALLGIGLQLALRLWSRRQFQLPLTLWWLMGAGGLVVAAIGPTSVWRTLTGRGWTWKGRALAAGGA